MELQGLEKALGPVPDPQTLEKILNNKNAYINEKHVLFSTFMYVEKHANYMQINYFPLVKEKTRS